MKIKRLAACLLAISLLLLVACQGGAEVETKKEGVTALPDAVTELLIVQNGVSDYVIVVPQGDITVMPVAYALRNQIREKTGVKLEIVKDSEAARAKEISVGATNRCGAVNISLGEGDYLVSVVDGKPLVLGGSVAAMMTAIELFVAECCSESHFTVSMTYRLEHLQACLRLIADSASDYTIVVRKGASAEYDIAYYLQSRIRKATDVRIPIVYDTETPREKEILVGTPDRTEYGSVAGTLESEQDFYVGAVGQKLLICAGDLFSLREATEWFCENYILESEVRPVPVTLSYVGHSSDYETLAMRINNQYTGERGTLETLERSVIYAPTDGWWFNHCQAVSMINGVLVAVWSQGRLNEGDVGQRIAFSTSTDFVNWSPMQPLVDSWQGEHSEMVLGVDGVYNNGSQLVVYFGASEYKKEVLRENGTLRPVEDGNRVTYGLFYVMTEDGIHWTEPQRYSTSGGRSQGPIPMGNGELLWAGGNKHAFSNDLSGLTWDGFSVVDKEHAIFNGARMLTESSFIVKDETILMFSRSGGNLWVSFSSDWGRSWSLPYPTRFTDASSKFMCGSLSDGRYYLVSNPGPNSASRHRLPLVLAISEDGINWNEQYILGDTPRVQRMDGMYKGGHYAYPNCFIGDDGYFYVIYSVHKEDVEIVRFKLSELGIE